MNKSLLLLVLLGGCAAKQTSNPLDVITPERLLADVVFLASDEMQGRHYQSTEARIAAKYIADSWKRAALVPLPGEKSMYLPTDDLRAAPNVAAMLQGSGEKYVLLTAHYDHLKPRNRGDDRIYNGADDNASGTAALLAIADALAHLDVSLEASIILVAFTGEEAGLVGSEYFAAHSPIPLRDIKGLINLDMISRGDRNTIFMEGAPDAPRVSLAISRANAEVGLTIVRNEHPDWLQRSDQAPFLDRGVPCVFLSVEDHEDYHRVTDHAEKIFADLAAKTAQLTFLAAVDLAHPVP